MNLSQSSELTTEFSLLGFRNPGSVLQQLLLDGAQAVTDSQRQWFGKEAQRPTERGEGGERNDIVVSRVYLNLPSALKKVFLFFCLWGEKNKGMNENIYLYLYLRIYVLNGKTPKTTEHCQQIY